MPRQDARPRAHYTKRSLIHDVVHRKTLRVVREQVLGLLATRKNHYTKHLRLADYTKHIQLDEYDEIFKVKPLTNILKSDILYTVQTAKRKRSKQGRFQNGKENFRLHS